MPGMAVLYLALGQEDEWMFGFLFYYIIFHVWDKFWSTHKDKSIYIKTTILYMFIVDIIRWRVIDTKVKEWRAIKGNLVNK